MDINDLLGSFGQQGQGGPKMHNMGGGGGQNRKKVGFIILAVENRFLAVFFFTISNYTFLKSMFVVARKACSSFNSAMKKVILIFLNSIIFCLSLYIT